MDFDSPALLVIIQTGTISRKMKPSAIALYANGSKDLSKFPGLLFEIENDIM